MKNSTTIAVIGAGRIGRMHAEIVAAMPAASLVGVVDRSRKDPNWATRAANTPALGELAQATMYASAAEAFADKTVEAVIIATSSSSHVGLILAAAQAGKKILCEKPVAFSVAAFDALQKELGGDGNKVQVAFNRRFDPHFSALQQALTRRDLGAVRSYHIINRDPKRPPADFIGGSGGMLADFNVHDFDMLRFLSGDNIAEIYARGANLIDPSLAQHGDIDTAMINIRMTGGALANIDCSRETNYGYDQRIEVLGEKGGLRASPAAQIAPTHYGEDGILHPPLMENFITCYHESYRRQTEAFLAACRGEAAFSPALEDTRRAVAVVEAGNASLQQNKPIAVSL